MVHPTTSGQPHIQMARRAPAGLPRQGQGRLGVLGGAYNPVTLAHLTMADVVRKTFALHEVLLLLPQVPPHKSIFGASLEQRLEMLQLAVTDRPSLSVGLSSHGLFVDMYSGLLGIYPAQTEVFFLTGRDAAERILTWSYEDTEAALRQMFTAFQLIVCEREGPFVLPADPRLTPYRDRIHACALPASAQDVSSTAVRQRCAQGVSLDGLVPTAVAEYIWRHDLYRSRTEA
jgi:nicotinate-nucleotide adenylyltransferase